MDIKRIPQISRLDRAGERPSNTGNARERAAGSTSKSGVTVSLSAAARALASGETGLSPERVKELRARIERGTYHTPGFAEQLAIRLLASGQI